MRDNPSDREDERVQRFLWLDQWIQILEQNGRLRQELALEFVEDLKSFVQEPPVAARSLEIIVNRAQTRLAKNVAYYELYAAILKESSVDRALGYLAFIEEDGFSDYFARAQELLSLQSTREVLQSRRVGVLVPLSGELEAFGVQVLNSIEIVSQLAMSDGVEFVIQDSGVNEDQLLEAFQKLVLNENVSVVIGPVTGKASEFVFERAQILGVPVISLAPSENLQTFGAYSFQSTLSLEDQIQRLADFIRRDLRARNMAILFPDSRYGWDAMKVAEKVFPSSGINIQEIQVYEEGDTDFKAELQKITRLDFPKLRAEELCPPGEENNPQPQACVKNLQELPPLFNFEVLFVPDFANTVGLLLPSLPFLRMYGVQVVGLSSLHDPRLIERGQSATEGVIFTDGFSIESQNFPNRFFVEQYRKSVGTDPSKLAAEAFDIGLIVTKALKESTGPVTRDGLRRELRAVRNFPGVTGQIYSDGQQIRKQANLFVVRDGKFKELQ